MSDTEDTPQHNLFDQLANPHPITSKEWTRHEQMRAAANEFHRQHPEVWTLMCTYAFRMIGQGRKRCSVNMMFELIRWNTNEAVVDPQQQFKINNNHRPFYSRRFMAKWPQHEGFFGKREQTSKHRPASHGPELGPADFPAE